MPKQPEQKEAVKESSIGIINEQIKPEQEQEQQQGHSVFKQLQKKTQEPPSKENVVSLQNKPVQAAPQATDIGIKNRLSAQSSDGTHTDNIVTKTFSNSEVKKIDDSQKTNKEEERVINSHDARAERQKNEARGNVQNMIERAGDALVDAKRLVNQAKLANQKAQDAEEQVKRLQMEPQKNQVVNNDDDATSLDLNRLINEAKISDETARNAVEKYNDLTKAAIAATEEFIARFG